MTIDEIKMISADFLDIPVDDIPPLKINEFIRFGENYRYYIKINKTKSGYMPTTVGDWVLDIKQTIDDYDADIDSPEYKKEIQNLKKQVNREKEIKNKECREKYHSIFKDLPVPEELHPYLANKKITSNYTAKIDRNGFLWVPVYDFEGFNGVQIIQEDNKIFPKGIKLKGSFCGIGYNYKKDNPETIYFCEGFATGCSVHEATNGAVIVCFMSTNLLPVISKFKTLYTDIKFINCADNDQFKTNNAGLVYAQRIKKELDVDFKYPEFKEEDLHQKPTDFNDLHVLHSLEEVRKQLNGHKEVKIDWSKDIEEGFSLETYSKGVQKITRDYEKLWKFVNYKTKYKFYYREKTFYIWNDKFYEIVTKEYFKSLSTKYFSAVKHVSNNERNEFFGLIESKNLKNDISFIKGDNINEKINFKNGVLDVKTMKFFNHTPELGFANVLPYDYEPGDIECPNWDKLLKNFTLERQPLIDILEEFMAFTVCGMPYNNEQNLHGFLVLAGAGENGKSTFCDSLASLVGDDNYNAVSLSTLQSDSGKFERVHLHDQMLVIAEEESVSVFKDTGIIKKISAGGSLQGERKGKDSFKFVNKAKIVMTYNEVPFLNDMTHGFRRRFLVIPCDLNLEEKHKHLKVPGILEKIKKERPAIVNRLLKAYQRLKSQGNFTRCKEIDDEYDKIMEKSNRLVDFCNEHINVTGKHDDKVHIGAIFNSYKQYEVDSNISTKWNKQFFIGKIGEMFSQKKKVVKEKQLSINGVNKSGYRGIKLIDEGGF